MTKTVCENCKHGMIELTSDESDAEEWVCEMGLSGCTDCPSFERVAQCQ